MAKATKIAPKPVKQPPAKIVLELSEGEADFILGMTEFISGHPSKSPRKYANALREALTSALGIRAKDTDAAHLYSEVLSIRGSVHFSDYLSK